MLGRKAELLEQAKRVVNNVMKTKGAKLLFNTPVDPVALNIHDYYDVIENPIDLGTIYKRLTDGQKTGWNQSYYQNIFEVLEDVRLVWQNCYDFNKGENDDVVRDLCRKTQEHFEAKWKAAQLPFSQDHSEKEIPNDFSLYQKSIELPIRLLNEFSILSLQTQSFFPLTEIRPNNVACIYIVGNLLPVKDAGSNNMESFPVCLDRLLDWCVQYGDIPGIWITTNDAWYKLLSPSEAYAPFLSKALLQFMVTAGHLNFGLDEIPYASQKSCLNGRIKEQEEDEDTLLPDDFVEIVMENEAVREGTLSLMRKRSRSRSCLPKSNEKRKCSEDWIQEQINTENGTRNTLGDYGVSSSSQEASNNTLFSPEKEVKFEEKSSGKQTRSAKKSKSCGREDNKKQSEEEDLISTRQLSRKKKNQKPSLKVKLGTRRKLRGHGLTEASGTFSDLEDDDHDPLFDPSADLDGFVKDDEDEDYINEHKKTKTKKSGESENQRLKREKKAMELLRVERDADKKRGSPPPMKADFRFPQELIGLALSCWDFFMTFHLSLEIPQFPFWRFEAAICSLKEKKKAMVGGKSKNYLLDVESSASALLLHDIHTSLTKVLQGKIQLSKEIPTLASLDSIKPSTGHWTQTVSLLLLRSPLEDVDEETRNIATFLHGHEYLDLTPNAKLKILHTLINMVLALESFHEHLNSMLDKNSAQRLQNSESKTLNLEVLESMELSLEEKSKVLSLEKWNHWFTSSRQGAMNTIGQDFRGAQYWILGGSSGAFKVYVEQRLAYSRQCTCTGVEKEPIQIVKTKGKGKLDNGMIWGYYEGDSIDLLKDWLATGDLDSEKTLLEALQNIPKPIKVENQVYGEELDEEIEEITTHKGLKIMPISYSNFESTMLSKFQKDDYKDIRFPLLRGEGELTDSIGEIQLSHRISSCVRALLSTITFWNKDATLTNNICMTIQRIQSAQSAVELAREIFHAMEVLVQHGNLQDGWLSLQKEWKKALQYYPSLDKILGHVLVLQSFVLVPYYSIHRSVFNGMTHDARCPLYFPLPGETIVVLKTGCLSHLDRYLDVSKRALEASGVEEMLKKSVHPEDLTIAKKHAEKLQPVEHFRVCCIAYRSSYTVPPPENSAFAEDFSIPFYPCMWMLLTPVETPPTENQLASLALPIHVDTALPDFVVKTDAFQQSIQKNWQVGDRFKMFFEGKSTARSHGGRGYYKGTISQVNNPPLGEDYDPWESLTVEWDNDYTGASMKVSPWEIEVDPEEQRKLEEARIRKMESQARYSRAFAKQQRSEYFSDIIDGDEDVRSITDPDYDPMVDYDGDRQGARTRKRGSALDELVYYDPKNPSGPVPAEMLAKVPGPRSFPILIHNFMQRLKGKFKCPVFSGKDLDLYKVFHEVQNRGGYDRVTNLKLWKEVCRTLNVNLKGQTSASYNMRLNYEKCLLDFEHYLSSGKYNQELENGNAPSLTDLEPFPLKARNEGSNGGGNGGVVGSRPGKLLEEQDQQIMTRGARRTKAAMSLSMTQLLMDDSCLPNDYSTALEGLEPTDHVMGDKKADWAKLISPLEGKGASSKKGKSLLGWIASPSSTPVVHYDDLRNDSSNKGVNMKCRKGCFVEVQEGESIGMAMDRMGWALIGTTLWRRHPRCGIWYKTEVTHFNKETNEFCLTVDKGISQESTEWIDLRELSSEEISQHDPEDGDQRNVGNVLPSIKMSSSPGQPDLSHLFTPPPALHRFGTDTQTERAANNRSIPSASNGAGNQSYLNGGLEPSSAMNPVDLISRVLSSGMSPEIFKQLVDDAAEHRSTTQEHTTSIPPIQLSNMSNLNSILLKSQPRQTSDRKNRGVQDPAYEHRMKKGK